jgi:hypothetical protein
MVEEDVGVNLVAEDESETEEDEDEDEEWWVGTVGVMKVPGQEWETVGEVVESEPEEVDRHSSVEDGSRLEVEPECPSDDCPADELAGDG